MRRLLVCFVSDDLLCYVDGLKDECEYGRKIVKATDVGFTAIRAESAEVIGRELGANFGV
jgi:hypothetical protein